MKPIMLNSLGGADANTHEPRVKVTKDFYSDKTDIFLRFYTARPLGLAVRSCPRS